MRDSGPSPLRASAVSGYLYGVVISHQRVVYRQQCVLRSTRAGRQVPEQFRNQSNALSMSILYSCLCLPSSAALFIKDSYIASASHQHHSAYPFFIPNPFLIRSSLLTTPNGIASPIPKNTNNAHFHLKGLIATQKRNQYINSEYVKKSKAPVGAMDLSRLVRSIQRFIQYSCGRARGSTRNIRRKRV